MSSSSRNVQGCRPVEPSYGKLGGYVSAGSAPEDPSLAIERKAFNYMAVFATELSPKHPLGPRVLPGMVSAESMLFILCGLTLPRRKKPGKN